MEPQDTFYQQAKYKAARYCAYQERCTQEVAYKLEKLGVGYEVAQSIIEELKAGDYVDDARFACIFASSRFRQKKWGRLKIRAHLKQKGISTDLINLAMREIEEEAYYATMVQLVESKINAYNVSNTTLLKSKIYKFMLSKGYEAGLVMEILNDCINENET